MVKRCWLMICQPRFKSPLRLGFTLNVSAVLLIDWLHLIFLMSIVKSSRTSEHGNIGVLVAQWLSAVG